MRVSRFLMAAGLAVLVGSVAMVSAQSKTDEDYDKLMKGVELTAARDLQIVVSPPVTPNSATKMPVMIVTTCGVLYFG